MALRMLLRSFLILIFPIIFLMSAKPASLSPRLAVRLIHPASLSLEATIFKNARETFNSRFDYLRSKATGGIVSDLTPMLWPQALLANLSIGDPPVPQLLLVDTGSDLLWIQCLPCAQCYAQYFPVFDPSESSSYHNVSCEDSPPASAPRLARDLETGSCRYFLGYRDGTRTEGVMAKETLTFQTADDGLASVPDVVFGCGHQNYGFNYPYSGLLGLGPGTFSLISKLGSKFSYCFGSLTDPNYSHNLLVFGDGARTEGDPTPLNVFGDRYYVNVEAISIGEKLLQIDPVVFQRTEFGTGGTIIDTGCSVLYLAGEAYVMLTEEVKNLLEGKLRRVDEQRRDSILCYEGNVKRDLTGFPVVTFHFSGGAELGLDAESLFLNHGPDYFCSTVRLSQDEDLSVIGAPAQQSYNVGYDLEAMMVYFQRIDCELLDD